MVNKILYRRHQGRQSFARLVEPFPPRCYVNGNEEWQPLDDLRVARQQRRLN